MSSVAPIDSGNDPAAAAEAVSSLVRPEEGRAAPPPDTSVRLFGGVISATGARLDMAVVRELTGEDEEALARITRGTVDPLVLGMRNQQVMLERAVVKIGNEEVSPKTLLDMYVGDRAALLLAIRRATYGDDLPMTGLRCPKCGSTFGVVIELGKDIKYREMEDPSKRTFSVPLRNGHTATVRLVTGQDQMDAIGDGDKTIAEQNSVILSKCLLAIDDAPLIGPQVAREMGLQDRHTVLQFLVSTQPGPLLEEVSVPCSKCDEDSNLSLSMVDLFQG